MSYDKYDEESKKSEEHSERHSIRTIIMSIATALFAITIFDAIYGFKRIIDPGISKIYNFLGTQIEPNMVTLIVFDWRNYDTLGEALILVSAVVVVLLIFGRGMVDGEDSEEDSMEDE